MMIKALNDEKKKLDEEFEQEKKDHIKKKKDFDEMADGFEFFVTEKETIIQA